MMKRIRIPLAVEAVFRTDGSLLPRRLFVDGQSFRIGRVLRVMPFCPPGVGCIAPIRYTGEVDGREKELYYEPETGTWFSVRERRGETRYRNDR